MKTMKHFIGLVLGGFIAFAAQATTLSPITLLNPAGSTSGQAIVSTGASSAPAWGNVSATSLAAQAANTVLANVTGSSASPAAFAMPSCSTSASALDWTSGTGFTCNTAVNAATLGGTTFAAPGAIGSTTPGSGAFTTLAASGTVSGAGFSTYLASPPAIGGTAAAAGNFTTLGASGLISPTSTIGIKGTTTNDSPQAGSDGENAILDVPIASSVNLTSTQAANVGSMSLTAGDWQCWGNVQTKSGSGTIVSVVDGWFSTTSAAIPAALETSGFSGSFATLAANSQPGFVLGGVQFKFASTTTLYMSVAAVFSTSTLGAYGRAECRRMR